MEENEPMLLLVEDDPADAVLIQRSIQKADIPVRVVHLKDGDEAVAYLSGGSPQAEAPLPWLILMDLKLPRRSGLEVLQWIRQQKSDVARVPVVMLSSSHHAVDIQRAYQYGVNSYLVKPTNLSTLTELAIGLRSYWLRLNVPPNDPAIK